MNHWKSIALKCSKTMMISHNFHILRLITNISITNSHKISNNFLAIKSITLKYFKKI